VQVEDSERVKLALAAVADRIDIADTLHVATTPGDARAFATFDRDLARRGKGRLGPIEVL
jgi:predicted nucleic acid-binding protein